MEARTVVPGLLRGSAGGATPAGQTRGYAQSGVWYRRGNRIVLQGA